jgi:hypothetical protein
MISVLIRHSDRKARREENGHRRQDSGDMRVLGIQRFRDSRRLQESAYLNYIRAGRPGRLVLFLDWDALALLRSEAKRTGLAVSDDVLIERVLESWGKAKAEEFASVGVDPPSNGFRLTFGDAPRPALARDLLVNAGLA